MRLSQIDMVNRHVDARRSLLHRLDMLAVQPADLHLGQQLPFVVTIDGQRQDSATLALLRPVLVRELSAQIASIDRDLEALGVEVD